jgi:hypothetical protein
MVQLHYYDLFLKRLHDFTQVNESQEDFIRDLTFAIALDFSSKTYIPESQRLDFFEEIEAEVIEIYRKKTYGFINLCEYRKSLLAKIAG